jgi:hypothetical protein
MAIQDSAIGKMLQNSDDLMPLQKQQMQFGLDTAHTAYDQSQEDRTWMLGKRDQLSGIQDTLASDAKNFNLPEEQNRMFDEANADVDSAFSNARAQEARGLSRSGVTPGSGKALMMYNQMDMAQAAARSSAAMKVRAAARAEGFALTDRANNALAGYPAMSAGAIGAGAGYGASGLALANGGLAGMNSGYSTAGSMAGQMGSNATGMYGAQANYKLGEDRLAADNDPMQTLVGAGIGIGSSYLMKGSDRRMKTDITAVGVMDNGLTVYRYRYRTGGPFELGVMADEVAVIRPQAYVRGGAGNGFDAVNYAML